MSKSRSLFGPRPGVVTLVEAPLMRAYVRKARVTFIVVGLVVALFTAVALSHRYPPIVALLLGIPLGALAGLVAAVAVLAWPVLRIVWHWAAEIAAGLVLLFGWTALMNAMPVWVSLLIVAPALCAVGLVPWLRRRVLALVWCAIVRHRLRVCFAEFIRPAGRDHAAHAPLILFARPTPAGERVWVWLRSGLELADLEGKTGKMAVTCWANQVRVAKAGSSAGLIRVDITRRDPLRADISSPLVDMIPGWESDNAPVSPGMPPVGLDLSDVPEPATDPDDDAPRSRRTRKPRNASGPAAGPVGDDDAFI